MKSWLKVSIVLGVLCFFLGAAFLLRSRHPLFRMTCAEFTLLTIDRVCAHRNIESITVFSGLENYALVKVRNNGIVYQLDLPKDEVNRSGLMMRLIRDMDLPVQYRQYGL